MDSAATSLKPRSVIESVVRFYEESTANVHRAVHALSEEATELFEDARARIARFINADTREIVFVRHATEALNLVAHSLRSRGSVAVPLSEHHSNLLPWRSGHVVLLDLLPNGEVDVEAAQATIRKTRPGLVSMSTVSNALGVSLPVDALTAAARSVGACVLLDLSQSVGHGPVDVQNQDCDFACFSGHKMLGPSGVGVLYCRTDHRDGLEPLLAGGSMVQEVHRDSFSVQPFPWGLEAGTPNIEGVIGLGAACDYIQDVGLDLIQIHGRELTARTRAGLSRVSKVTLHAGLSESTDSIVAFSVAGQPAHGVARILSNRFGIMVRSGYHCAQPLHEELRLPESVRASFHLYNTPQEVDALVEAIGVIARIA